MRKIKLTPKQKEKLTEAFRNENIAKNIAQKASQDFGNAQGYRNSLLELIYEVNGITPTDGEQVKVEGDYLILPEAPGGLKKRVLKTTNQKSNGTKSKISGKK